NALLSTPFPYTTLFRSDQLEVEEPQPEEDAVEAGDVVALRGEVRVAERAPPLVPAEAEEVDPRHQVEAREARADVARAGPLHHRSEEHTSELQSRFELV